MGKVCTTPPAASPLAAPELATRIMLETRWGDQWPPVKVDLGKARTRSQG